MLANTVIFGASGAIAPANEIPMYVLLQRPDTPPPVVPEPILAPPPVTHGTGFFSWMPYTAITYRNSRQFEMRQSAVTGEDGLRRYNGQIKVAIGTGWGFSVGSEVYIILSSGTSFAAVVGDIKDDRHTCDQNKVTRNNGCALEFLICRRTIDPMVIAMGNVSRMGFEGELVSIIPSLASIAPPA